MRRDTVAPEQASRLTVRVSPRANREAHEWEPDGTLHVWLTAPAVENAANRALVAYLAKTFKIRQSEISLIHGQASRRKVFLVPAGSVPIPGSPDEEPDARGSQT
jgi:uncharacterized protein YggU (UPF0235/DUF167 family)